MYYSHPKLFNVSYFWVIWLIEILNTEHTCLTWVYGVQVQAAHLSPWELNFGVHLVPKVILPLEKPSLCLDCFILSFSLFHPFLLLPQYIQIKYVIASKKLNIGSETLLRYLEHMLCMQVVQSSIPITVGLLIHFPNWLSRTYPRIAPLHC